MPGLRIFGALRVYKSTLGPCWPLDCHEGAVLKGKLLTPCFGAAALSSDPNFVVQFVEIFFGLLQKPYLKGALNDIGAKM